MKIFFVFLVLSLVAGAATVSWLYPSDELSGTTFRVLHTTNVALPLDQWQTVSTVEAATNATVDIQPGRHFFTVTASNFWGVAPGENVVSTPVPPKPPKASIAR